MTRKKQLNKYRVFVDFIINKEIHVNAENKKAAMSMVNLDILKEHTKYVGKIEDYLGHKIIGVEEMKN